MTTKTKKQYTYDYPEQRELCTDLISGDQPYIAKLTGYTTETIRLMCLGKRKMQPKVEKLVKKILKFRNNLTKESINN